MAILPYVGETAPLNYLLCDGSVYNKSDYPELAEILGTADVFNTPDLRSRIPVGYDSQRINGTGANIMFAEGGEQFHTLTVNEMPSHTHRLALQTGNQTGLIDRISVTHFESCNWYSHVEYVGGSQSHNNMPPYIVLNYIIRAK